jgi:hypothetical protein
MIRPRARVSVAAVAVAVAAALVGVVGGCSDEPAPTVGAYCDAVRANLQDLINPSIATTSDIEATIDRYRSIADVAPLGVESEWRTVIQALETAATVVPSDPASVEIANRAALAGTPAYGRLQGYTQNECDVAIGTPPTPTNPVTATTVVAPTTDG